MRTLGLITLAALGFLAWTAVWVVGLPAVRAILS